RRHTRFSRDWSSDVCSSDLHPMVTEMLNPWAKDVEQATEGRVKIQVLPPLGTPASHYDLVRNGVADMTIGVHSYTPERFKLTEKIGRASCRERVQSQVMVVF